MQQFIIGLIDAGKFTVEYQREWRALRDSGDIRILNEKEAEAFDRIFTASDCYRPPGASHSTPVDIDEETLRSETKTAYEQLTKE